MKIVLAALNAKYIHSNLAVYDIEAYAKEKLTRRRTEEAACGKVTATCEVVVKEYTINQNLDWILQSLYLEKAAVVAFSCYIWNMEEVLIVARELCQVAPWIHIWLGGPEVSYNSRKLLQDNPCIEGVMRGEGEATFAQLTDCWMQADFAKEEGLSWTKYYDGVEGITYRIPGKEGEGCWAEIIENPARPLLSLDEIPFVYDDLTRFENKILYYETSRGCPFSCSYCLSSIDKTVRFRSLSLVQRELQFFLDENVPQVKFIDRTFNCNRKHALAIWRYIKDHDNGVTNFHFEVAADLIGEEELELFRQMRPGLIQLEIGLQSTNENTIREIRRKMDIACVRNTLLSIHEMGNIHQHLDLIAGLPYEDYETFQKSFNEAYAMAPDQLQLGFLKVLKGSYMETCAGEYELRYQKRQPYEVLSTRWISYEDILGLKQVEEMVEVYYNSGQFPHVLAFMVPLFESPFVFYKKLGEYYDEKQLYGIGFRREARYEVLREWFFQWLGEYKEKESDLQVFDCLLTYDYYLRENAKNRPGWAGELPIDKRKYQQFFRQGGNGEICLMDTNYDSKAAARMMHVEPVVEEAMPYIYPDGWVTDGRRGEHPGGGGYALFDYTHRNPLSKAAHVTLLSSL